MDNNLTSNNTKGEGVDLIKEHFRKTQLVPFCIIMVVGILANTTVIVNGIQRRRTIRHYSNYFVLSMAFADLGVVVIQVPLAIFEYTLGMSNISQFTCKYVIQTRETFQGAGIFSVSFLAFIRARQVMSYPCQQVSRRTCRILITGIWLLSYLLCTLPLYFIYKVYPDGYCDPDWGGETVRRVYLTSIICVMLSPMIMATISYSYVICKVRNTRSPIPNEGLRRKNRNVTALLISLILSCWISYVPIALLFMLEIYTDEDFYGFYGWSITAIFYVSGSALNPVLVLVTMPHDYRYCLKCKVNNVRPVGALQDPPKHRIDNVVMEYNNQVCSHPAHFTNSSGKICQ